MLKDGDYVGVQSNGTTFPFPLFFEFFFSLFENLKRIK